MEGKKTETASQSDKKEQAKPPSLISNMKLQNEIEFGFEGLWL